MQATHFKPDEGQGLQDWREHCTLENHSDFADLVFGERKALVADPADQVWYNVLRHTRGQQLLVFVWAIEILILFYIVMSMCMEMWGACPVEMGLAPVCRYCYSQSFLIWNGVLVALWFLDLYLFVLLVSKGFSLRFDKIMDVFPENEAKGIPPNAISTFLYLTAFLLLWIVVGCFILAFSTSCAQRGPIFSMSSPGRSGLLVTTTTVALVCAPVLLLIGRRASPVKSSS